MRHRILLFASLLIGSCQGTPAPAPTTAPAPEGAATATATAAATATATSTGQAPASAPLDDSPSRYLQTPTVPLPADAQPVRVELSRGASLLLPPGTRTIKIEDGKETKPTVRHYYLNHPLGRGLSVTEYPLKNGTCEALVGAREAAFEAGHRNRDEAFLALHRFHRGARCELARARCYFSDTSRRTREEVEKGARFHREAAYLLCRDGVAISVAWKVPDGAEVTSEVIDALTRIAGSLTLP